MANREERKAKQREYYASHADYYRSYYKKRVQQYRSENETQKEVILPSFVASFSLPLFHTLFLMLIYLTYMLNI